MFAYSIVDCLSHTFFPKRSEFFHVFECNASTENCYLVGCREDIASVDGNRYTASGQAIFKGLARVVNYFIGFGINVYLYGYGACSRCWWNRWGGCLFRFSFFLIVADSGNDTFSLGYAL